MISPGNSRVVKTLNAIATLIVISWVVVVFPLYLVSLAEHHKINDAEFTALLEYMGGSGVTALTLHGLSMWLNTPDEPGGQ